MEYKCLLVNDKMANIAVCYGMNYKGSNCPLNGCVNDAKFMGEYLKEKFKFDRVDIFTDDSPAGKVACSRQSILAHLNSLVQQKPQSVFLHFSCHGTQISDASQDETDGKDECLVAADLKLIVDDEMRQILGVLGPSANITIVADCCHSATIIDPAIIWESEKVYTCETQKSSAAPIKCNLITLSGCRDAQTSADVYSAYRNTKFALPGGALTSTVLSLLRSPEGVGLSNDVFALLSKTRAALAAKGFKQMPVVGTSRNVVMGPPAARRFVPAPLK